MLTTNEEDLFLEIVSYFGLFNSSKEGLGLGGEGVPS